MLLHDDSNVAPVILRTNPVPAEPETPSPSGEPRPATLTCIESQPQFEKLRAGVYEEYVPPNFFLYRNVDRHMRTVLAWRALQDDPAFRAALAERTSAGRSFQSTSRHLAGFKRRR